MYAFSTLSNRPVTRLLIKPHGMYVKITLTAIYMGSRIFSAFLTTLHDTAITTIVMLILAAKDTSTDLQ